MPPDTSPNAPYTAAVASTKIRATRTAAVASLIGLIVVGLAWELWLAPLRPGGSFWAIKVIPLCFPLAGLLKNRMYTYRWMSLLIWLYFTEGVVRAWSDTGLSVGLALAQTALCLALFVAVALHVRWRLASVVSPASIPTETPIN
jgi:uncharacterized membrane protein